jgi:tetratricopeptide (TPR) repeat protein
MLDTFKKSDKTFIATFRLLSIAAKELAQTEVAPKTSQVFIEKWEQLAEQATLSANLNALKLLVSMLSKLLNRYPQWQRFACRYNGKLAWITGDYVQSQNYFRQQLKLVLTLHKSEDNISYYKILLLARLDLAEVSLAQARFDETEQLLWQGLSLSYEYFLEIAQMQFLNRLGRLYQLQERPEQSLACLEQSLSLLELLNSQPISEQEKALLALEEAFTRYWIGAYHLAERNWQTAEKFLRSSMDLSYRLHDTFGILETLLKLGIVYYQQGYYADALICFEGSLASCEQLRYRPALLQANYYKALICLTLGRYQEALNPARQAVEIGLETGENVWLALAFYNLGQVYQRLEIASLALVCHMRVAELYHPANKSPQWIEPLISTGDFLLSLPDAPDYWEQALRCYRQAIDLIETNQKLEHLAPVLGKMARAFTKVKGLAGLNDAARCYRLELRLAGDLDSIVLPPAVAVALRVEALTGLQCCAALQSNQHYHQPVYPVHEVVPALAVS